MRDDVSATLLGGFLIFGVHPVGKRTFGKKEPMPVKLSNRGEKVFQFSQIESSDKV